MTYLVPGFYLIGKALPLGWKKRAWIAPRSNPININSQATLYRTTLRSIHFDHRASSIVARHDSTIRLRPSVFH
jgi:hypothetical protein